MMRKQSWATSLGVRLLCWGMVTTIGVFSRAEIYIDPLLSIASGKYQERSYAEARLGAVFSMQDQFLRLETAGFHRFYSESDNNYSGLDFGIQIQRWFQITQSFLLGTRIGPGYRWSSNEFDAGFFDFSLSFKQINWASFRVGYKIFFHELRDSDLENENMLYVSFEF